MSGNGAGSPIRVLVADDQDAVRTGLVLILSTAADIEVIGEAGDGLTAVRMAAELTPDVILMDVRMPGIDGTEATRRIVERGSAPVLVLTTFDLDEYVDSALAAGAAGFLLKSVTAANLLDAVRAVARGDGALAPEVTRRVLRRLAAGPPARPPAAPPDELDLLTGRETEVLACLGRGLSNADIAGELVITEATAKSHVSRVLTKLGLRSRVQAAILAQNSGLVPPG